MVAKRARHWGAAWCILSIGASRCLRRGCAGRALCFLWVIPSPMKAIPTRHEIDPKLVGEELTCLINEAMERTGRDALSVIWGIDLPPVAVRSK